MSDSSSMEEALAVIVEEFMERLRRGERPSIEIYAQQHPTLANEIRQVLPALLAVERDLSIEGQSELPTPRGDLTEQLGDYRILREIGRGGMGIVYEAVQQSLGRHVALKVLPWSSIGPNSIERFRREARAAARLHHTNIVPVFEVGVENNTHFFAMQFIRGQGLDQVVSELRAIRSQVQPLPSRDSIATRLAEARLASDDEDAEPTPPSPPDPSTRTSPGRTSSPNAVQFKTDTGTQTPPLAGADSISSSPRSYFDTVARIVLQVAEALAYAHHHGIVHRDVKPANILLDMRGTAWVTDFGLAKSDEEHGPTRTGDVLGTLRYMSPERYEGISDPRSDIYGLGATFYELLTLRPLFEDESRPKLIDAIRRREPTPPRKIDSRIPRDLEVICLKCLAKEMGRRYDTADRLAQDLQRYLNGQTITARSTGSLERSYRWCRRNPVLAGMLAALVASMSLGLAGTTYQWLQARDQRDEARTAANRATDESLRADAATVRAIASRLEAQRLASRTALAQGRSLADQGAVAQGMLWMAAALREIPPGDHELERLLRLNLSAYQDSLFRSSMLSPDEKAVATGELSGNRQILATSRDMGNDKRHFEASFWDCDTGKRVGPTLKNTYRIWLSNDGRIAAAFREEASLDYLDVMTGRVHQTFPVGELKALHGISFTLDGKRAVEFGGLRETENSPGILRIRDLTTGALIGEPLHFDRTVYSASFRPDGQAIAVSCIGAEVSLWELGSSPRPLQRVRMQSVKYSSPLTFHPDGRHLIYGWSEAGVAEVRFLDADTGALMNRRISLGDQSALDFSYSPDARLLLTTESGELIRFWDAATDQPVGIPAVQIPSRTKAAFLSSGDSILQTPFAWDPAQVKIHRIPRALDLAAATETLVPAQGPLTGDPRQSSIGSAVYAAKRDRLVVSGLSAARVIDPETGLAVGMPIRNSLQGVGPIAVSRDGTTIVSVSNDLGDRKQETTDCRIEVCQFATGERLCTPLHPPNSVLAVDISPEGRWVATGDFSDGIQLWDTTTGRSSGARILVENIPWSLAFSPDGRKIAVGTHVNRRAGHAGVTIWDLEQGRAVGPPARHQSQGTPDWLIWTPDSSGLVSLNRDSSDLMRIDATTGVVTARASDFTGRPTVMIPSPDDRFLLTGTAEGSLEIRDATSLERVGLAMSAFEPGRLRRGVNVLAFSPDGRTIASGYLDGTVRLWDLASRSPIGPPQRSARSLLALVFRHQGRVLTSLSRDGEVRSTVVREPIAGPVDANEAKLEAETGLHIGSNQDFVKLSPQEIADRRSKQSSEAPDSNAESPDYRHERLARFAENQGQAITALFHIDRFLTYRPSDGLLRIRRALALAAMGRIADADAEFNRALTVGPKDGCLDLVVHRGLDARDSGRLTVANWAFTRAIQERPNDWRLYVDRSIVREQMGDLAGRDLDADLAAQHGAESHILAQKAEALMAMGKQDRARSLLEFAANRDDDRSPLASRLLATHEALRGRVDRAADILVEASKGRPTNGLQRIYLQALAALAHNDVRAYGAIRHDLLARNLAEATPSTLNFVAWIGSLAPPSEESKKHVVELATAAVERGTPVERGMYLNTLGAALIRSGQPLDGIRRIEEGIRLRGSGALSQDSALLAIANVKIGNHSAAVQFLKSAAPTSINGEELVESLILFREATAEVLDYGFPADPFVRDPLLIAPPAREK